MAKQEDAFEKALQAVGHIYNGLHADVVSERRNPGFSDSFELVHAIHIHAQREDRITPILEAFEKNAPMNDLQSQIITFGQESRRALERPSRAPCQWRERYKQDYSRPDATLLHIRNIHAGWPFWSVRDNLQH